MSPFGSNNYYQVTYGTFTAQFKQLTVDETTLYAEDGITEIGVKHDFTINGWMAATNPMTPDGLATMIQNAQCNWANPRQTLTIAWSKTGAAPYTTLYMANGDPNNGSVTDIDFGPKPQNFSPGEYYGGVACRYTARITTVDKQCYGSTCSPGSQGGNGILVVTKSWDYSIGPTGLTTRTVNGKLIVTGQLALAGQNADTYRSITAVTIPCPGGFKREGLHFTQSPNARELQFSITDREVVWQLPTIVAGGHASYAVNCNGFDNQGMCDAILSGHYEAGKFAPFAGLLQLALNLVDFYVPTTLQWFCTKSHISQDVYGNALDFQFHFKGAGPFTLLANNGSKVTNLTVPYMQGLGFGASPPGSITGVSALPGPYGGVIPSDGSGSGAFNSGNVTAPPAVITDACDDSVPSIPPTPPQTSPGGSTPVDTTDPGSESQQPTVVSTGTPTLGSLAPAMAANPIYQFKETISFELDLGLQIFAPLAANANPIKQQARIPMLRVIQAGFMTQIGSSATQLLSPPSPILNGQQAWLLRASPRTVTPQLIGNSGVLGYTQHWCYEMQCATTPTSTSGSSQSQPAFNNTPILTPKVGGFVPGFPELIPTP